MSADIELTLVSAVAYALPHDFRLLGVVVAWLEVHGARVNVPRLGRIARCTASRDIERAFWAAIGAWLGQEDARWLALGRLYEGAPLHLDEVAVSELQLLRVGADPRFDGTTLKVHAKLLRSRITDVDEPVQLARRHPVYRKRLEFGPSFRADVWAALECSPSATPAEIARLVGCAYETARAVAEDWKVARAATAA